MLKLRVITLEPNFIKIRLMIIRIRTVYEQTQFEIKFCLLYTCVFFQWAEGDLKE